jgi:hypothetical protein
VIGVLVVVVGLAVGGYFYAKKKRIHVCCLWTILLFIKKVNTLNS